MILTILNKSHVRRLFLVGCSSCVDWEYAPEVPSTIIHRLSHGSCLTRKVLKGTRDT
jgi:hypothetical protein